MSDICDFCYKKGEFSSRSRLYLCKHKFCDVCVEDLMGEILICPIEACSNEENQCSCGQEYSGYCATEFKPFCQLCEDRHEGHEKRSIGQLNADIASKKDEPFSNSYSKLSLLSKTYPNIFDYLESSKKNISLLNKNLFETEYNYNNLVEAEHAKQSICNDTSKIYDRKTYDLSKRTSLLLSLKDPERFNQDQNKNLRNIESFCSIIRNKIGK